MPKSIRPTLFLSLLFLLNCAGTDLYRYRETNKLTSKIPANRLKTLAFFVNKKVSWYGVTDRFYAYFGTIDPIYSYFKKNTLIQLAINLESRINYLNKAKENGLKPERNSDYEYPENHILMKKMVNYYPLLKKIAAKGDHFLLVEQQFNIVLSGEDSRAAVLTVYMTILNDQSDTVFCKKFIVRREFTQKDFDNLVNFRQINRRNVQQYTMQMYTEMFLKLTPSLFQTLGRITHK